MKLKEQLKKLIKEFKELQNENDLLRQENQELTMKLNSITDFVSKKRKPNEPNNTKILQQTTKSN